MATGYHVKRTVLPHEIYSFKLRKTRSDNYFKDAWTINTLSHYFTHNTYLRNKHGMGY